MTPSELSHRAPSFKIKSAATKAGLSLTVVVAAAISLAPSNSETSALLMGAGTVAAAAGGLLFWGTSSSSWNSLRHTLGSIMVAYGLCAVAGGVLGHFSLTAPLEVISVQASALVSPWKAAKTEQEADSLIQAAKDAHQKTLVFWGQQDCDRCQRTFGLSVLDPSINPGLQGYRLIRVETTSPGSSAQRARFGVSEIPTLTLMRVDGSIPEFGTVDHINAQTVMDLLEMEAQEDAEGFRN